MLFHRQLLVSDTSLGKKEGRKEWKRTPWVRINLPVVWKRITHAEQCDESDDIRKGEQEASISDAGALGRGTVGEFLAHKPDGELAAPDDGDVEEPGSDEGLAALLTLLDEFGLQKHDETFVECHEVGAVFEVVSDTAYIASVAGGEHHHD